MSPLRKRQAKKRPAAPSRNPATAPAPASRPAGPRAAKRVTGELLPAAPADAVARTGPEAPFDPIDPADPAEVATLLEDLPAADLAADPAAGLEALLEDEPV